MSAPINRQMAQTQHCSPINIYIYNVLTKQQIFIYYFFFFTCSSYLVDFSIALKWS